MLSATDCTKHSDHNLYVSVYAVLSVECVTDPCDPCHPWLSPRELRG